MIVCACALISYGSANARVSGVCQNCHTMHNSEQGKPVALTGTVSWQGGILNGDGTTSVPDEHLLKTDCIGCHSNSGGQTIVLQGGMKVPIVNNLQQPSQNTLAGGDFYWVQAANTNGHHVLQANALGVKYAPGLEGSPNFNDISGSGSCGMSCHATLYDPVILVGRTLRVLSGCQGCHYYTFHHKQFGAYSPGAAALKVQSTYRFLSGHHYTADGTGTASGTYVLGLEDPDWEQSADNTNHNVYAANGPVPSGMINSVNHSLSSFCAACHTTFHTVQADSSAVWIRHPVDVLVSTLVTDGHESLLYNGPDGYGAGTYDPAVPVAYDDLVQTGISDTRSNTAHDAVTATTGKITCVSCHRTHGSPNAYMLRFNYQGVIAGNAATAGGTGCFACHTDKALK